MYVQWKEGQITWEYGDAAHHCWEKISVAKAQLVLKLDITVGDSEKGGGFKYIN